MPEPCPPRTTHVNRPAVLTASINVVDERLCWLLPRSPNKEPEVSLRWGQTFQTSCSVWLTWRTVPCLTGAGTFLFLSSEFQMKYSNSVAEIWLKRKNMVPESTLVTWKIGERTSKKKKTHTHLNIHKWADTALGEVESSLDRFHFCISTWKQRRP